MYLPVRHSISITYKECNLAPEFAECQPVLEVFYDAHFERNRENGGVVDIAVDEHANGKTYTAELQGGLSRMMGEIPPTACIGIASWVIHRNEQGFMCFVDAGTAHINMAEIHEGVDRAALRGEAWTKDLDLVMHTTGAMNNQPAVIKGKIQFACHSYDIGSLAVANQSKAPTLLRAPMQQRDHAIMSYVQQCLKLEMDMPDAIKGTERVRAPMDISESGIELTGGMFLPVGAYAMFEVPRSNLEYWQNAFNLVMHRQGFRKADFRQMDKTQKARTMALVVTLQAQTFDYIGDTVDRNVRSQKYETRLKQGYENFGDATVTTSGDCEDTATVIQQNFRALLAFEFPPREKALREMQSIAKQYMPLLTLAVVHGAKADDENAPKGAHMYVSMLPMHQVQNALNKTSEGRACLANAPWDRDVLDNIDPELPTLFGEGTGKIDPLGYMDKNLDKRKYLYQAKSLSSFKKELPHERGAPSAFYLGNMMGITSEFVRKGGNYAGFVFCTQQGGQTKRGTLWTDVINQVETMALVPHPPIPAPIMDVMREATALRVPPRGLLLNKELAAAPDSVPELDRLSRAVQAFGRGSNTAGLDSIDAYIRPHQLSSEVVDRIVDDLMRMQRVFKVDYEVENITTLEHQYRVRFWIK